MTHSQYLFGPWSIFIYPADVFVNNNLTYYYFYTLAHYAHWEVNYGTDGFGTSNDIVSTKFKVFDCCTYNTYKTRIFYLY